MNEDIEMLKAMKLAYLPKKLRMEIKDFVEELKPEITITNKTSLETLYRLYHAEKAKRKTAKKQILKRAEKLLNKAEKEIKAIPASTRHKTTEHSRMERITEKVKAAGRSTINYFRKRKGGEETIIHNVGERISPIRQAIREQLEKLTTLEKETREKLEEQLEKKKYGDKLA